ncbi:ABC transporter permease subunit [Halorubellus salinus]|uniref:ABC transporter permease subunit n=1 Tax=Halorubellus salinus TaxID=755309 RepID=UPI001D086F65|nr:ABC transporter permease subunit [Halorubellus salinus]
MTTDRDRLFAVADRELVTMLRTPQYVLVAVGFVVVVLGLAVASGLTGYVPLAVDLLAPVEVLVPLLAVAFGYRSLGAGTETTERPVLRTYPMPRWAYVGGVYVGRAVVVCSLVFATLLVAGVLVPFLGPEGSSVVATHGGEGSFGAYLRFVVLATAYAAVVLAAVLAVSAVTSTARTAVAAAVALFVLVTVGVDLAFVGALASGVFGPESLRYLQALGPNGAFRGLVLTLVVRTVDAAAIPSSVVVASAIGLAVWLTGALALATAFVWPTPQERGWERVDATATPGEDVESSEE